MRIIPLLCVALIFSLACSAQAAPRFPSKPIQLVVPYAPGGGSDISARIFADAMKDILPQPVVVSNVTGAGGLTGAAHVLNSRPDGHTVFWEHASLILNPLLSEVPFRWTDFAFICIGAKADNVLVVKKDSPWNSVKDVVEAIRSNPGKIRYSCAGTSQFSYLDLVLAAGGGLEALVIPMAGDKPRIVSLLGDNCDVTTVSLSSADPYVQSGDIKMLGVLSERRSAFAPDLPTCQEQGYDVVYEFLYGVHVPAKVPADVQKALFDAFKKAADKPETKEALSKVFVEPYFKDAEEGKKLWKASEDNFLRTGKAFNLLK